LTGAGFGGAVVVLCERDRATTVSAELCRAFAETSGKEINVLSSRIADGAA
jgi:galactokinase